MRRTLSCELALLPPLGAAELLSRIIDQVQSDSARGLRPEPPHLHEPHPEASSAACKTHQQLQAAESLPSQTPAQQEQQIPKDEAKDEGNSTQAHILPPLRPQHDQDDPRIFFASM